ncbi:MAG: amidase, partial [Acidobacteria bacterium]|nr:amidase [Acidobacteriota bacterium]
PVTELGPMLRSGQVTSTELTHLYLDRIEEYDPALRCVITTTRDLALAQAEKADRELRAGRDRGPLHGIPWGAKDLLAVPGYPTTWGAKPFRDQVRPETATVVSRLREAGAVLVAKTSCGALAWGDVWFDATTKNPWNGEQGSSGSSAGSASATAAGLVGFSLGTETLGSIVSPCTRCGCTGLRPTFGRVSRHGAMALSWSMDKIGPICRSVEDCALVFHAIHGSDGRDPSVADRPFTWPLSRDPRALRVGYVRGLFDEDRTADVEDDDRREMIREWQEFDRATLKTLEDLGFQLIPMELPATYPVGSLSFILAAEAAATFDHLTRSGLDDTLVRQSADAWPNVFRQGQMIPAVEYLRANRIRTLVMKEMEELMAGIDLYVSPTFAGSNLLLTNLTGHPQVVLPNGFRAGDGTPTSITFTGRLFGETELLAVARAYQEAGGLHLRHPDMQTLLAAGRREDPWTRA